MPTTGEPLPVSTLDTILTLQLAVAWAGEGGGEARRLGWWRTDMVSRYGFLGLAQELLPRTGRWAAFEAVREAARRIDEKARKRAHDPDAQLSLYRLGFVVDERLAERLADLKARHGSPDDALPQLGALVAGADQGWDADAFATWLSGLADAEFATEPTGRRLRGPTPASVELLARKLARGLLPLAAEYPAPYARVSG